MNQSKSVRGADLRIVAIVFVIAVAVLVLRSILTQASVPILADTDDAMRMVVVRDFLGGQNWFDSTAHRLNTPWGADLHWSRLIDVPIAALLLIFTPLLGADTALVVAGYIWPMLLLGVLLWLSAQLAHRLVGPEGVLPALVLPLLSPPIIQEFTPGRVDHHNVIIILTLAMAWTAIEGLQRRRFAIACGLLAATALAIATESLAGIAAAILVMGFAWVLDPTKARMMREFGLAFALGSVVHLALFRAPARWFEAACDVISPFYVGVALVVGLVYWLVSLMPTPRQLWQRLAILAVSGGVGVVAILLIYPQCLGGPYAALDPWLQTYWIGNIVEARPWHVTLLTLPAFAVAVGVPTLLAIAVLGYRLLSVSEDRLAWSALLVFLVCTAVVMLAQVRGARLSIMEAIPAAAWLIVVARQRYIARPKLPNILGLVLSWVAFSGVVLFMTVNAVLALGPVAATIESETAERTGKAPCLMPEAFADLAPLPAERIMSPIDLGAHIMLYTPHEVVSAPYHRNQRGVRDTFRFFNDPIDDARAILTERGIGLVVLCPAMPEVEGFETRAPDSFAALYEEGQLPAWLEDVSLPETTLKVFAVLPPQ